MKVKNEEFTGTFIAVSWLSRRVLSIHPNVRLNLKRKQENLRAVYKWRHIYFDISHDTFRYRNLYIQSIFCPLSKVYSVVYFSLRTFFSPTIRKTVSKAITTIWRPREKSCWTCHRNHTQIFLWNMREFNRQETEVIGLALLRRTNCHTSACRQVEWLLSRAMRVPR